MLIDIYCSVSDASVRAIFSTSLSVKGRSIVFSYWGKGSLN